jgi:G3E family GTPase
VNERVPFSILTGFLGAGKTTLLNRLLASSHDRRVAVLVNELGRVAIDNRLILSRGGDVLELAGGCVCCKIEVKNDLWDGIRDVIDRSRPDHVVLETTGIAEPQAIIGGLDREQIRPAGVICVVDADAGLGYLERREEAVDQVDAADRILLSKLDVAPAARTVAIQRRLREINPDAERAAFPATEEGTQSLVRWLLEVRPLRKDGHDEHRHLHRQGQITAATFVDRTPLLAEPLLAAVEQLRDQLYRVKGFVHLADEARRGFLELAGNRVSLQLGEAWAPGEARQSELVFIGEELDELTVRRRLWACRAAS